MVSTQDFESCVPSSTLGTSITFSRLNLFNLNKKYDLDGDVSWNTARLINHSCSNNCDYNGTGLKLWVVAIKDIKKGEEITGESIRNRVSEMKVTPFQKKILDEVVKIKSLLSKPP